MLKPNFRELLLNSNSVDLPSLFDIAARLTQAQLAGSQGSVALDFVQVAFDKHIEHVSGLILEAIKTALEKDEE